MMRMVAALLCTTLLALSPRPASAQDAPARVVDLQSVESNADAPKRSAFGRVMDVMISALVQQQASPRATAQAHIPATQALALQPAASPAPPRATPRATRAEPRIRVALGERFALPPAGTTALAAQETSE